MPLKNSLFYQLSYRIKSVQAASYPSLVMIHYSAGLKGLYLKRDPPFVGIDDFAFKKRMSYEIIFIDLKTQNPIQTQYKFPHQKCVKATVICGKPLRLV